MMAKPVALLLSSILSVALARADDVPDRELTYPDALVALAPTAGASPENAGLATFAVLVDKTARLLKIYRFESDLPHLVFEVPADLGKSDGEKAKTNDHKTPTGLYFLTRKKTRVPFGTYGRMAFETDYPNFFDRLAGKTGSGIWLHAVPDSVPLTRGSRGCVVVRNEAIVELEKFIHPGQTPILILDEIRSVSAEAYRTQKSALEKELEAWRAAWEGKDVEAYMKYYAAEFRESGMNRARWRKHKEELAKKYTDVKITLGTPVIVRNKEQLLIRFRQKYASPQHQDYGEKTISARLEPGGQLAILSENWVRREEPGAIAVSGGSRENPSLLLQSAKEQP